MDLEKLEAGLRDVQQRSEQMYKVFNQRYKDMRSVLGVYGYNEADFNHDMRIVRQELLAQYNPRRAERPLLNEAIAAYEDVSADERSAIREILQNFGKLVYFTTLSSVPNAWKRQKMKIFFG